MSHNLFLSLKPVNTHPSKRANCKVTHRVELGTFSRVPSTSKKTPKKTINPKPKLPNQNHPSNICKTFHGVFEKYFSFWNKIITHVVFSTNLQSCMRNYLWQHEQFDFKVLAKNTSALLSFISQRKILISQKRFFDDNLQQINNQGFDYPGFAQLAKQNPNFRLSMAPVSTAVKDIPHDCDNIPKQG